MLKCAKGQHFVNFNVCNPVYHHACISSWHVASPRIPRIRASWGSLWEAGARPAPPPHRCPRRVGPCLPLHHCSFPASWPLLLLLLTLCHRALHFHQGHLHLLHLNPLESATLPSHLALLIVESEALAATELLATVETGLEQGGVGGTHQRVPLPPHGDALVRPEHQDILVTAPWPLIRLLTLTITITDNTTKTKNFTITTSTPPVSASL